MRQRTGVFSVVVLMTLLVTVGYGLAGPVPDTGQTKCYDASGNEITCPQPGEPFYGQDGNYAINPPSYTKLDAQGNDLPDSTSSWAMTRDNVTGLIWEVKQNKDGVQNYADPSDADNTYTWYDSNPITNGGNAGWPGDGTDTEDFLAALNSALFGGYSDWRLPTSKELNSIVDYGRNYPSIDSSYFPNTQTSAGYSSLFVPYLSSKINPNTGNVAGIDFLNGKPCDSGGTLGGYVRAVRGEKNQNVFVDNGDGTITDRSTGLTWQQDTAPGTYTWKQALSYCESLTLAGHTDWRLPTVKEFYSIVDDERQDPPIIDTAYFPDTKWSCDSCVYWLSTSYAKSPDSVLGIFFNSGNFNNFYKQPYCLYVRAVRGGQSGSLTSLDSIAIDGPTTVQENCAGSYSLTACYSDGSCQAVTGGVGWSVDSPYATIGSDGTLAALSVDANRPLTITAEFDGKSATKTITIMDEEAGSPARGYNVSSELWTKAVLEVPGNPVPLVWQMVGAAVTPSGAQVISGYFYADPNEFAYGSQYNPEVFVKIYIDAGGWCNIAFNHVTVDPVTVSSAHQYAGTADRSGSATMESRLVQHEYTGVAIDTSKQSTGGASGSAGGPGYTLGSDLWSKAVLQVEGNPVTLIWKEVGTDTTPSGAKVISGYFYADPAAFAYGSQYNPEVFVKVYIDPSGWTNMAFNHVTVDPVSIGSAHGYAGAADQSGTLTLSGRLLEHVYTGVSTQ